MTGYDQRYRSESTASAIETTSPTTSAAAVSGLFSPRRWTMSSALRSTHFHWKSGGPLSAASGITCTGRPYPDRAVKFRRLGIYDGFSQHVDSCRWAGLGSFRLFE